MKKLLLVGNFVNDVILIHQDLVIQRERSFSDLIRENPSAANSGRITKNTALGGSVTYASLASTAFGGATSYIVSNLGTDINDSYKSMIESKTHPTTGTINTDYIRLTETINTSYQLNYYNHKKNRTLLLLERGQPIDIEQCLRCVREQQPDAISFVPIAGEIEVDIIVGVLDYIAQLPAAEKPKIVAFDIQGLLRSFSGQRVTTHSRDVMIQRLTAIGNSLKNAGVISILKSEYSEAIPIVGGNSDTRLSPGECAQLLRTQFHFTLSSVTMGGDGGFISSEVTGDLYIPTFKPAAVMDETGCGDTFLSCTILELLHTLSSKPIVDESASNPLDRHQLVSEDIVHCLEVGSAGASFLVEQIGPNGFASRSSILDRVHNGQKQSKAIYQQSSAAASTDTANKYSGSSNPSSSSAVAATAIPNHHPFNSLESNKTNTNETSVISKPPKSTTHYF